MKIPFDSLCFTTAMRELRMVTGAKVQKVTSLDEQTVAVELYHQSKKAWLVLSSDPQFSRALLAWTSPTARAETTAFCTEMRRHLIGCRLIAVVQPTFARVAEIVFEGGEGQRVMVAECMGKHSNIILLDENRRVVAASKWVGRSQSRRPILVGFHYSPPPISERPSILNATSHDDLTEFEGASPFLCKWITVDPEPRLKLAQEAFARTEPQGYRSDSGPTYPLPIEDSWRSLERFGTAFELYFGEAATKSQFEHARAQLLSHLNRVQLAREVSLSALAQTLDSAAMARHWQVQGELILAYQGTIKAGDVALDAFDYEGNAISIALQPDLEPKDNAERYFRRAKRAKAGYPIAREQHERLSEDLRSLRGIIQVLESATTQDDLDFANKHIEARRWIRHQSQPTGERHERPFEGKAIRELLSPGGFKVFYGDNSEANEYLSLRLGKPNDLWFHVRGGPSAHVLLVTQGKPEKVQKPDMEFAARIAALHSSSKHSRMVPVDYTLRKYVRRQRGASPGSVIYTHEKTLHVDPGL